MDLLNLHLQRGLDKSTRFNGNSTRKSCTIDRRTSSQKKLNNSRATIKLTRIREISKMFRFSIVENEI